MPVVAAVVSLLLITGTEPPNPPSETAKPLAAKDALQPFNVLIGSWKGTGYPEGVSREDRAAGMWVETISWEWQFRNQDAWLKVTFEKGKYYTGGELRYSAAKRAYQLALATPDKSTHTFAGTLKDRVLTLDRVGGPAGEEQRLVVSLLHHNRYLYRLEARPAGAAVGFTKRFQVGATKEGVAFADVPKGPECIVSGGAATMRVTYQGKDYYVCCSGCRDAFKEDPEKFIQEAAAKGKK